MKTKEPYIITERVVVERHYNPEYGDDRICRCGHTYYRHFDSYEQMDPVGCKYCSCDEFKEASCQITEGFIAPKIGMHSLIGVLGEAPHAHGNYFALSCGSRVLNFWAENLEAAVKQFNLNEIWVRRYKGEGFDVCLIDDSNIPDDWYLKELCFTGCATPPIEVLSDIFWFGGNHYARKFKNDIERFTNPASYYNKKGLKYVQDPESGLCFITIPVGEKLTLDLDVQQDKPNVNENDYIGFVELDEEGNPIK